jgi:hypothetical protein
MSGSINMCLIERNERLIAQRLFGDGGRIFFFSIYIRPASLEINEFTRKENEINEFIAQRFFDKAPRIGEMIHFARISLVVFQTQLRLTGL